MFVDLHPVTNKSPYTVVETMSLAKAAILFRELGLRHLCVVPKTPGVRTPFISIIITIIMLSFRIYCQWFVTLPITSTINMFITISHSNSYNLLIIMPSFVYTVVDIYLSIHACVHILQLISSDRLIATPVCVQTPPIVGILTRHDFMPEHILGLFPHHHSHK